MTGPFPLVHRRAIERDALQVAQEVANLPRPVLAHVAPLLAQAERETADALRRWIATAPGNDTRFTAYQYSRVLVQLRTAFDTIKRISPTLASALGDGSRRAGVLSVQHIQSIINRNSSRFGTHLDAPIRLDLARVLATGEGLIPRFASSAARYSAEVREQIKRELAVGVLRGETYHGLVQRLAARSRPNALPTVDNAANGLLKPARWQAERLVRTEMAHASEVQAMEAFRQARVQIPDLRRVWNAALDSRLCRRCAEMDGTVSDATGHFPGDVTVPLHPSCRCCVTVWREAWGEMSEAA